MTKAKINFFTFLILLSLSSSLSLFAEVKFSPIADGEFDMDDATCWLLDSKEKTMLYAFKNEVKIKLDSKIISLVPAPKQTPSQSAILECGKTYKYSSADNLSTLEIVIEKSKSQKCRAKMLLTSKKEKTSMSELSFECGK